MRNNCQRIGPIELSGWMLAQCGFTSPRPKTLPCRPQLRLGNSQRSWPARLGVGERSSFLSALCLLWQWHHRVLDRRILSAPRIHRLPNEHERTAILRQRFFVGQLPVGHPADLFDFGHGAI